MSKEITKEDLLNMKLHEEKSVPCKLYDVTVRRVFGGWIYTTIVWDNQTDTAASSSMCFVPEVINVEGDITQHF